MKEILTRKLKKWEVNLFLGLVALAGIVISAVALKIYFAGYMDNCIWAWLGADIACAGLIGLIAPRH